LILYLTPSIPLSMIWIYIPCMRGKNNFEGADAPSKLPTNLKLTLQLKENNRPNDESQTANNFGYV